MEVTDQQIELMRRGIDATVVVQLRAFSVALRPLTMIECTQVAQEVTTRYQGMPLAAQNRITENALTVKCTLFLASMSGPKAGNPQLTEAIMDNMFPEELNYLFKSYTDLSDRVNPSLEKMSTPELMELVDQIKKKEIDLISRDPESQLLALSFWQLRNLVAYLLETKGS